MTTTAPDTLTISAASLRESRAGLRRMVESMIERLDDTPERDDVIGKWQEGNLPAAQVRLGVHIVTHPHNTANAMMASEAIAQILLLDRIVEWWTR